MQISFGCRKKWPRIQTLGRLASALPYSGRSLIEKTIIFFSAIYSYPKQGKERVGKRTKEKELI
jgi:hypothetical protein